MALVHCDFPSATLGLSCSLCVILPDPQIVDGRVVTPARKPGYKTLWLLHGWSDDHTIWQRRTSLERYVAGTNLAVVMPAVHRSFYVDMARGPRYGTFISEELPAMARAYFPLSDRRQDNFVAGLSMGGYGAFRLALTYPQRYAAAASLSGALDIEEAYHRHFKGSREIRDIFGPSAQLARSPNNLFHQARKLARSGQPQPKFYQCCGAEDFLYQDNLRFRDHAAKLGLDLTYEEGPGAHNWGYWDAMIQNVLAWLPLAKS